MRLRPLLHTLAPLLCAAAPAAQVPGAGAPPSPPATGPDGWELVDGVAAQAGDRIVRTRELLERVDAARQRMEVRNRREEALLVWNVLESAAADLLMEQEGADREKDREQLDTFLEDALDRRARQEGVTRFGDQLQADGLRFEDLGRDQEAEVYRSFYVDRLLGRTNARGGRPIQDPYIRPSKLRAIYETGGDVLDPSTVQLRFFVLDLQAVGGAEEDGEEYLEDIRRQVLAGADFAELIGLNASMDRANQGLQPSQPIAQIPIAELREFARDHAEGELSDLISIAQGETRLLILARIERKEEKPVPPFTEQEVQRTLRQRLANTRDQGILTRERQELLERSYTWYLPELRALRNEAEGRSPGGDAP